MDISETIINYIKNPIPLWNEEVANVAINYKWNTSLYDTFHDQNNYTITGCVLKDETQKEKTCILPETNNRIRVAFPSNKLSDFYDKHGLVPSLIDISLIDKIEKINRAIKVVSKVSSLHSCVLRLVKSVQIIESESAETDISYSHPDIPFSIFLSVCADDSVISDLRVAESILHESMHLMLTLIENRYDLIVPGSQENFYSPWRDEQRPVRGVLHGMFVFKAIFDFYTLLEERTGRTEVMKYISGRKSEIAQDFSRLTNFPHSLALTEKGRILSFKLLLF